MDTIGTQLQTAAEAAVTNAGTVIGAILVAGFTIAVGFFIYKKIRGALSKS